MKIGDLRRSLFMNYDCEWNSVVRDVTARKEKHDEEVSEYEVTRILLDHLTTQAKLDITFPYEKGSRIQRLFTEDVA
jgi:hypothetical protein